MQQTRRASVERHAISRRVFCFVGPEMTGTSALVPYEGIENHIFLIRSQRVMLDADLATLYGVETRVLNQAVRRNIERFPADFLFQLTADESALLRSQTVTLKTGRGQHRKYRPYAFTEHGAIMAASILNSPRAIEASVWVVRAFVKMREALATNRLVLRKLGELEAKVGAHDAELKAVIAALKSLMIPPGKKKRAIGFGAGEGAATRPKGRGRQHLMSEPYCART